METEARFKQAMKAEHKNWETDLSFWAPNCRKKGEETVNQENKKNEKVE